MQFPTRPYTFYPLISNTCSSISEVTPLPSQSKSANMSEYAVDENTRTKKFMNRLTLDNFYHKYFNLYEISMEKEVIPSASY